MVGCSGVQWVCQVYVNPSPPPLDLPPCPHEPMPSTLLTYTGL